MHETVDEAAHMDMSERVVIPLERPVPSEGGRIDCVIDEVSSALTGSQADDGHWAYELEADATIPAEYILLNHFLGEIDGKTEAKLANYLRSIQGEHGGWPLYHDGDFDMSASVKAYYALKMTGDDANAPHMKRTRQAILAHGGASKCNIFTRIMLALFGQVPWRATPVLRVEALLLPKWAPFHINKVSYWSRTVMVPLLVLAALKPRARNPRDVHIPELFVTLPEKEKNYMVNPTGDWIGAAMLGLDRLARVLEPLVPRYFQRKGIARAISFITERLNGEDGLGGIFPAMANAVMAFDALGYDHTHTGFATARKAVDKLLVFRNGKGYCQPCLSPLWDTCLASHAMMEAGYRPDGPVVSRALEWMRGRQILDVLGDWAFNRGHVRPGGWAFQYWNDHYPDVDDTAVVVMAMHRADPERYREAIKRGAEWVVGMQSRNGGWGAFDADNDHDILQHIPFADHGALLDPPTADVTARCISMLAQLGYGSDHPVVSRAMAFLMENQEADGSWFGRWGNNYVYGTWSVLCALRAADVDLQSPPVRRAVEWLKSSQWENGGWGEDCASYWQHRRDEVKETTPSQTAWAILGLLAAGEVESDAVERGIEYLIDAPRTDGKWDEEYFNAVGFPRIFYLRYHGYSAYFPLWALARYRRLTNGDTDTLNFGM